MHSHTIEGFAQDKWRISPHATVSLGVRYDLEVTPVDETDNPLFKDPRAYPVDKNNLSPRLGFSYGLDSAGKSVIRGGYGLFYGRTLLGTIESFFSSGKFSRSFRSFIPTGHGRPWAIAGTVPDGSDARERAYDQPRVHRCSVCRGDTAPQHRRGDVRFA